MSDPQDVTVSIFGSRYTLRSDDDPERLTRLAAEVDERMREAAAVGGKLGADRIAVLTALNLADELARERQARNEDREELASRTGRILAILSDEVGSEGVDGV
jgi:cell division protein ZapA